MGSNDSPENRDRGKTSDILGLPSGGWGLGWGGGGAQTVVTKCVSEKRGLEIGLTVAEGLKY